MSKIFPRQEHWSGLPFPSPEDLPNPGIEPMSSALAVKFFTTSATWEVIQNKKLKKKKKNFYSLAVQWLGLGISTIEGFYPCQGTKVPPSHIVWPKRKRTFMVVLLCRQD